MAKKTSGISTNAAMKSAAKPTATKAPKSARPGQSASPSRKIVLLSGGNPQIAKAYGEAPVQAYIAAMPGWKGDVGRRLDVVIVRAVPPVQKAVKWNSPFYGLEGEGWFVSFHCFTKFVRLTFFRGSSLRPVPPGTSKYEAIRYFDIREDDPFDEVQLTAWMKQASQLPGERL
jgi:hypothetical protein